MLQARLWEERRGPSRGVASVSTMADALAAGVAPDVAKTRMLGSGGSL